jgi:3-oxoacyl-[acyl-carrier protein] reductase
MAQRNRLSNKVALVTGASGGIGRAVARALAADGASVALAYGSHAEPAQRLADELITRGGHALAVGADLREPDAPANLLQAVEPQLGSIDVLVAAAGLGRQQTLDEVKIGDFDEMLAVNLRAPFLLAQQTLPGMRARGFGRILFVSSVAAFTGGIVGPHYAASKAGLHGLTHFLASRAAGDGVTVNAIAPALITNTEMLPGEPEELKARVPVGRLGQPDEVADLALAMLRNPYLTNQVVSLDGGMYPR